MSTIRQDAWSEDEDLLLAETVLRHIREGSTQLVAFEEVGKALSRTSAACGFRWNSLVRKKYENAIMLAKKQRKELQNQKKTSNKKSRSKTLQKELVETPSGSDQGSQPEENIDLEHVISYLKTLQDDELVIHELRKENQLLKDELEQEKKRSNEVAVHHQKVMKDYESVKSEYRAMLSIMDKARKLAGAYDDRVPEKISE